MRRLASLLAALLLAAPAAADSASSSSSTWFQSSLNATRASAGLGSLRYDATLAAAAQAHAADMARTGQPSHVGSNGSRLQDRVWAAGCRGGWMAENIAWGQPSHEAVLTGWMASPGHAANMMGTPYAVYGLGQVGGMWVMVVADGC